MHKVAVFPWVVFLSEHKVHFDIIFFSRGKGNKEMKSRPIIVVMTVIALPCSLVAQLWKRITPEIYDHTNLFTSHKRQEYNPE